MTARAGALTSSFCGEIACRWHRRCDSEGTEISVSLRLTAAVGPGLKRPEKLQENSAKKSINREWSGTQATDRTGHTSYIVCFSRSGRRGCRGRNVRYIQSESELLDGAIEANLTDIELEPDTSPCSRRVPVSSVCVRSVVTPGARLTAELSRAGIRMDLKRRRTGVGHGAGARGLMGIAAANVMEPGAPLHERPDGSAHRRRVDADMVERHAIRSTAETPAASICW